LKLLAQEIKNLNQSS